jgi:transposase
MWEIVRAANPRVGPATRMFVDTWLNAVVNGAVDAVADDAALRSLVAEREKRQKKAQSRLTNERLLRTWSGEAGSAGLTYRWASRPPRAHRTADESPRGLPGVTDPAPSHSGRP